MSQLNAYFVTTVGWRRTLHIYSFLYSIAFIVLSSVFKRREPRAPLTGSVIDTIDKPTARSLAQLLKDRAVLLMMATVGVGMFGYQVPFANIVGNSMDRY